MSELRETPRRRVCFGGRIVHECILSDTACIVRDLSNGGARLRVSEIVPLPARFDLVIACRDATLAAEVVWRRDGEIGVRFLSDTADSGDEQIAALREILRENRAEAARLRERLAAFEAGVRVRGQALH